MTRARLALCLFLASAALALASACGGSHPEVVEAAELPPANPEAVRELVAGARILSRPGTRGLERARGRFEKALALDPNLWEAHYDLGVLERRLDRLDEAVARFEQARAIQPAADEPLMGLAEARYAQGELGAAADLLEELVTRSPEDLGARVALATILREQERWDEALEQAREVLVRNSSDVRALLEVGRVYRARERFDVAQLVFQKAFDLTTEEQGALRAEVRNEQGLVELSRGDTQSAFQAFELAAAADSRFAPARMNRASVLLHAGDYEGAAREYRAVLALDEDDLDARVALGVALRGLERHDQARREYERVLEAEPRHLAALFDLGVLRAEFLNEREGSREQFQAFLDIAPRSHPQREAAERYLRELTAPTEASGE